MFKALEAVEAAPYIDLGTDLGTCMYLGLFGTYTYIGLFWSVWFVHVPYIVGC